MLLGLHSFVAKSSSILPPLVVLRLWCCWGLFFSASLLLLTAGFDLWLAHTPLLSFSGSDSFFVISFALPGTACFVVTLFVLPVPNRRLMVQYPNGEVWERINEQVKPMLTPCTLWPSVPLAAKGHPGSDVVKQSFSSPQWIFFKNLPSLPSYLIIHWKLWEWLAALMKDLLFHTGMLLVSLWHLAQSEFWACYSLVWCECLSTAVPHNNHSRVSHFS